MNNKELLELAALAYGIDSYAPHWLNDPKNQNQGTGTHLIMTAMH